MKATSQRLTAVREAKKIDNGKVVFDKSVGDNIPEQFSKKELEDIFSQANLQVDDISKAGIAYLCTLSKR